MANLLTVGYFYAFSNEFMYFLCKYTVYDITDMVNKCAACRCISPLKSEDLNKKEIRFVNRSDCVPTKHSVLCKFHFEDIYKNKGKHTSLNWSMKPIPTIHSAELIDMPSVLPITDDDLK